MILCNPALHKARLGGTGKEGFTAVRLEHQDM